MTRRSELPATSVGRSMRRKEDPRLLTGRGKYAADFRLPDLLHAAVMRSPHPHARLGAIRAKAALALPGVVAVVTAEDALEVLDVDYDPLPTVSDARRALEADAPVLHEVIAGNLVDRMETRKGDAARALAGAVHRVRETFAVQRHTGVPMETRGLTAAYEAGTNMLRLWGVAKVPHFNRRVLADILVHPEHLIQFVEMEVGGGFGVRGEFYPEDLVIPWAAMHLGRPVQWVEDRREHLMAANHSRQQYHDIEVGFDADYRIVALVDRFTADLGAYIRTHGVVVPELTAALLPGPYRIPNYLSEARCVL